MSAAAWVATFHYIPLRCSCDWRLTFSLVTSRVTGWRLSSRRHDCPFHGTGAGR